MRIAKGHRIRGGKIGDICLVSCPRYVMFLLKLRIKKSSEIPVMIGNILVETPVDWLDVMINKSEAGQKGEGRTGFA